MNFPFRELFTSLSLNISVTRSLTLTNWRRCRPTAPRFTLAGWCSDLQAPSQPPPSDSSSWLLTLCCTASAPRLTRPRWPPPRCRASLCWPDPASRVTAHAQSGTGIGSSRCGIRRARGLTTLPATRPETWRGETFKQTLLKSNSIPRIFSCSNIILCDIWDIEESLSLASGDCNNNINIENIMGGGKTELYQPSQVYTHLQFTWILE